MPFFFLYNNKKLKQMINFFPGEQNQAELNLLKTLIEQNHRLSLLDPGLLTQIGPLLKIPNYQFLEVSEKIIRLKNRIMEILYEEKDSCLQYIEIYQSKIQNKEAFIQIRQIVEDIWNQFKNRDKSMGSQKIVSFLCSSNNIVEQENFHLKNFQLIQNFFSYNQSQVFQHGIPGNFQTMAPNMVNRPPENMYPSTTPQQLQNIATNYPFNMLAPSNGLLNFQMGNSQTNQKFIPKIQQEIRQNNPLFQYKTEKKVEAPFSVNKKVREMPQLNLGSMRSFWYCVCKGKITNNQKIFTCSKCDKKFHFSCLQIPQDVKQKLESKICPFCLVKGMNIFFEMVGQPVDFFFVTDKDLSNKKIVIKNKKCRQIIENKQLIQIRFLRIVGKTLLNINSNGIKNWEQKRSNKLGDIMIKQDVLRNHNGEDVKINFDHAQFIPHDKKNSHLLFVSACIVRPLQEQQLLLKTNQYFPDNYLQFFFSEQKEEIRIQIISFEGGLIDRPGRGSDCNHPDVFDVKQFINFQSTQTQFAENNCFVCRKRIYSIKIDRVIQRQLDLIRQSRLPYIPQYIYYRRDGTFRWEQQKHQKGMDEELNRSNNKVQNVEEFEEEMQQLGNQKIPFENSQ